MGGCKLPEVQPKLVGCACYKASQRNLVTFTTNLLQPGAERTQQGQPGQQVSSSGVEECGMGAKALWQQLTEESRLNMEVSEARIQPADRECRAAEGPG